MYYGLIGDEIISGPMVTTSKGTWTEADRDTPPEGWRWFDTWADAARWFDFPVYLTRDVIEANVWAVYVALGAPALDALYVDLVERSPVVPFDPVPPYGHGPGMRVTRGGVTWRNDSGTWTKNSPSARPDQWTATG